MPSPEIIIPTGNFLTDPVTLGSETDLFGTHFDYLGIGGWRAHDTVAERDAIPVTDRLESSNSSGRRRRWMVVYCNDEKKSFQLQIPDAIWEAAGTDAEKIELLANNGYWEEVIYGEGQAAEEIKYSALLAEYDTLGVVRQKWYRITARTDSQPSVTVFFTDAGIPTAWGEMVSALPQENYWGRYSLLSDSFLPGTGAGGVNPYMGAFPPTGSVLVKKDEIWRHYYTNVPYRAKSDFTASAQPIPGAYWEVWPFAVQEQVVKLYDVLGQEADGAPTNRLLKQELDKKGNLLQRAIEARNQQGQPFTGADSDLAAAVAYINSAGGYGTLTLFQTYNLASSITLPFGTLLDGRGRYFRLDDNRITLRNSCQILNLKLEYYLGNAGDVSTDYGANNASTPRIVQSDVPVKITAPAGKFIRLIGCDILSSNWNLGAGTIILENCREYGTRGVGPGYATILSAAGSTASPEVFISDWNPTKNSILTTGLAIDEPNSVKGSVYRITQTAVPFSTKTSLATTNDTFISVVSGAGVGAGHRVSGANIPPNTFVAGTSSTTVILNNPVTLASGAILTFTPEIAGLTVFTAGDWLVNLGGGVWATRPGGASAATYYTDPKFYQTSNTQQLALTVDGRFVYNVRPQFNENKSFIFRGLVQGSTGSIWVVQDATGGRTVAIDGIFTDTSTTTGVQGSYSTTPIDSVGLKQPNPAPNSITEMNWFFDGVKLFWNNKQY